MKLTAEKKNNTIRKKGYDNIFCMLSITYNNEDLHVVDVDVVECL